MKELVRRHELLDGSQGFSEGRRYWYEVIHFAIGGMDM